jgi:hypothetical protein
VLCMPRLNCTISPRVAVNKLQGGLAAEIRLTPRASSTIVRSGLRLHSSTALATTFAIRGAFPFLFLLTPYFNTPARVRFACSRSPSIDSDDQGVLSGIANVLASCAVLSFCLPVVVLVSLSFIFNHDSAPAQCLATCALAKC